MLLGRAAIAPPMVLPVLPQSYGHLQNGSRTRTNGKPICPLDPAGSLNATRPSGAGLGTRHREGCPKERMRGRVPRAARLDQRQLGVAQGIALALAGGEV